MSGNGSSLLLAGDIGGTKTRLALYAVTEGEIRLVRETTFPSREFRTFDDLLARFLGGHPQRPSVGCLGVAGAVIEGQSRTTNLPWCLDEKQLAEAHEIEKLRLMNDAEMIAYGMLFLGEDDTFVLHRPTGPPPRGNCAVIAAGTGLGEAMLGWDGARHHPVASEGGHSDFAPRNDLEIELLQYLSEKYGGHVSYERVVSGPGLHNLYLFLRDTDRGRESERLADALRIGDPSATISRLGLSGKEPICVAALDLFCILYGAEAGNLALKSLAVGGVFLAGGIAPKILPALHKGEFMRGFREKGRLADFLGKIEVCVSLNPRAPVIGAAQFARTLLIPTPV